WLHRGFDFQREWKISWRIGSRPIENFHPGISAIARQPTSYVAADVGGGPQHMPVTSLLFCHWLYLGWSRHRGDHPFAHRMRNTAINTPSSPKWGATFGTDAISLKSA